MSDSSSAPVVESSRNVAAPSTRSWSERSRNPSVERPSTSSGWLRVKPWALKLTGSAGNASHVAADAADRIGEGLGADAGDVALGHEVADWPGAPAHRHELAAHLDAELQVGLGAHRQRRQGRGQHDRQPTAPAAQSWLLLHRPHGRAEGGQGLHAASRSRRAPPVRVRRRRAPASARPAARPTADREPRGRRRARARPATASPAPGRAGTPPPRRRA